jgi:hypothetical protein
MENLQFEYQGEFITFSGLDGEDELQICSTYKGGYVSKYLCVEQVIALKDYLIKQLNNLPNELKGVSNNEDNKRICPNCRGKIKHVPYTNIIDTCLTCGGSGQI